LPGENVSSAYARGHAGTVGGLISAAGLGLLLKRYAATGASNGLGLQSTSDSAVLTAAQFGALPAELTVLKFPSFHGESIAKHVQGRECVRACKEAHSG
jgi:hypothetical protein